MDMFFSVSLTVYYNAFGRWGIFSFGTSPYIIGFFACLFALLTNFC